MVVNGVRGVKTVLGTPFVVIVGEGGGNECDDELDEADGEFFGDGGDVRL
jgi:hypothetical protein